MTFPINRHRLWQLAADAALVAAAWWLAFQLRFDRGVPPYYEVLFERTILLVVAIKLGVFVVLGFYNRWWRYVSTRDMWRVVLGVGPGLGRGRPDRLLRLAGAGHPPAALDLRARLPAQLWRSSRARGWRRGRSSSGPRSAG